MRFIVPVVACAAFAVTTPVAAQFAGMPVTVQTSSQATSSTVDAASKQAEIEAAKRAEAKAEAEKKAAESAKQQGSDPADKAKPAASGQ